jgi:catechol 2,3-dioxygenase-like lactoylglutathione lyase family enzyme
MIKKFWHVGLTVNNLDMGIAEYEKLGFELDHKFEKPEPKAHAAHMKHSNGSGIELWEWIDEGHPQVEFIRRHMAFESDDFDNDVKELLARGYELVIPKTPGVTVTYAFVKDKSGNFIEIAERKS